MHNGDDINAINLWVDGSGQRNDQGLKPHTFRKNTTESNSISFGFIYFGYFSFETSIKMLIFATISGYLIIFSGERIIF